MTMAEEDHRVSSRDAAKTFPVKPKLKPTSNKSTTTPESKYWRSFKAPKDLQTENLAASINSISFSPTSPHDFAATHSATVTIFSAHSLQRKCTISSGFSDIATSTSFRCDARLLAAGDLSGSIHIFDVGSRNPLRRLRGHSGSIHIFDVGSRNPLRRLRGHSRAVRVVQYPRIDKLHLFSGGDDTIVKYWDVTAETPIFDLVGHKDYVRCGDVSPVSDDMFLSGSYDHTVRVWDIRVYNSSGGAMEINHGKPVEDVIYLPSGGLIATAGGNSMKIWDVHGGGKLLYSMESHNKTITSLCVGKVGKGLGEEADQYRILSVGLDGYMKVFDYTKLKITHSMRFLHPLLSIGFSPDCSTRVIGTSTGTMYVGRRNMKKESEAKETSQEFSGLGLVADARRMQVLRPSYFRYFHRGQNEKPSESDHLIMRPKKVVKLADHDKLLKKFRHKLALVAALNKKKPENVMVVMEELVARKKLMACISNLDHEELGLLLSFLQRYSTMPRYAAFLTSLTIKVMDIIAEDVRRCSSNELRGHIRNLKRDVEEEIRIQQSLQEIQGIISPLLRISAVRR